MRLIDYFIDDIIFIREVMANIDQLELSFGKLQDSVHIKLTNSCRQAEQSGFEEKIVQQALFAIVAYIDELILCSAWHDKTQWQKQSLQRKYFSTSNIGALFYERLNTLDKTEPSEWVREVYVLILGLGFKGRYFSADDQRTLADIKEFNISLLIPESSQRTLETATLFPTAYTGFDRNKKGQYKIRLNVLPYTIGAPILISIGLIFYFYLDMNQHLTEILNIVQ